MMTSTHTFVWETCNEPGLLAIDLINYDIDVKCGIKVRRCCELHTEEDRHKKHDTHRIGVMLSVRDGGALWKPIKVNWMTNEKTIGPAKVGL